MADDDIDAMLEEPFSKEKHNDNGYNGKPKPTRTDDNERSSSKRKRSRSRDRSKRSPSREKDRERRRDRSRDRSRRGGSRDREKPREPPRERRRSREREEPRFERYRPSPPRRMASPVRRMPGPERRDVMPFKPRHTPPRNAKRLEDLTPEERDCRTIFVMQLSARVRPTDLEEFFSSVGKVRDVRIITDSRTKRSKGIAYVEFYNPDGVPLALGLNGQRLLGAPLMIQPTQSEKNRIAGTANTNTYNSFAPPTPVGPMKLYVGSLHLNITEDMLRDIFEPFGRMESMQLVKDPETNRSRGYAFVTYYQPDDAKRAMEQLNGFEIAGRAIKVSHVTEHIAPQGGGRNLDADEMDRQGVDLGTTGRLHLMAKLAEGTDLKLPNYAQQILSQNSVAHHQQQHHQSQQQQQQQASSAPSVATQCFMLTNMFDPAQESGANWELDIRDDVIDECNKHGGCVHIFVDKASPQGNVYIKCPSVATAVLSVNSLHGRWFSGKVITANYVPIMNYHQLFPDSINTSTLLGSS